MEKHYLLQRLTSNSIYHFDLSIYRHSHNYQQDIEFILGYKPKASNIACYDYLVYLFAQLSGYNARNTMFRVLKLIITHQYKDLFCLKSDPIILRQDFKFLGSSSNLFNIVK